MLPLYTVHARMQSTGRDNTEQGSRSFDLNVVRETLFTPLDSGERAYLRTFESERTEAP